MAEPDIGTTPTHAKWFKREGYPISEYTIRQLIKSGKIRARYVGPKALTSRNEILRYFQCIDSCDNAPTVENAISGIRRIDL